MFDQEYLGEIASEATAHFDEEILVLEDELLATLTEEQKRVYHRIEELNLQAIGVCQHLTLERLGVPVH